jgi:hypothetical protein
MPIDLYLAPLVVAQRLPLLWLESVGLSASGKRESERMVAEKMAATVEGVIAAHIEMQRIFWQSGVAMMRGAQPAGPLTAGMRLTQAALEPAARRVRGNAKRLSRKKR